LGRSAAGHPHPAAATLPARGRDARARARFRPELAALFATLLAFAALGSGPALAQAVGVAAAVNQSALGAPPGSKVRTLSLGDKVIHNEKISTNASGLLQILLADGTSFTVGPSSQMVIDSFVYDPDANAAKVVATFGKGVFRFIGGRTSKTPDGAVLNTPVGTVGIRGGIGDFDFSGRHGTPPHIDMLFGDWITLSRGGQLLGRLYEPGYSLVLGGNGFSIIPTPPGWASAFRLAFAGHGGPHQGGSGPHVTSSEIIAALTGPKGPPAGSPAPLLPAGIGNFIPPPNPTLPSTGAASWAQIDNSSLAGAFAYYNGPASANVAYQSGGGTQNFNWDGQFYLFYHFGTANGEGALVFADPGDDNPDYALGLAVSPTTTNGKAGFAGSTAYSSQGQTLQFEASGQFENTAAGVAHHVTGTMSGNGSGVFLSQSGGTAAGTANVSGTFSGDLKASGSAP
jgi:hypothetical protein